MHASGLLALLCVTCVLASNVAVGPAITKLAIGSSVNFTIERGVSNLFSLDTSSFNGNTTFLEVIIASSGPGQCFCNFSTSAYPNIQSLSFPAAILLSPSLFLPNYYANGTKTIITVNETMGYCLSLIHI